MLLLLFLASCEKEETPINEFRVVVESTADISCGLPVIRFLDKESEVKRLTDFNTLSYNAYSLDNSLNTAGDTLIIQFIKLSDENFRICNRLGISYPGIKIVSARLAD
ncbi:MAG: hypothetical protein ABJ333_15340 [Algoriphagus sp.]|uniref:hypothetical protein n=1 Tax=Algoriphagus sp. TaxID=1872435 RepID=UPI00329A314C